MKTEVEIKANELMLGDWVFSKSISKPCKVIGIDPMEGLGSREGYTFKLAGPNNEILFVHASSVKPIPLTAEILEKNGFSADYCNDDLCYAQSYGGDVIGIHINGKNGCMDEMYFKYVHELQHAFRLCGIDKEIEL